jgi:5-methylcytosine-specific restriction endonuclease McrA
MRSYILKRDNYTCRVRLPGCTNDAPEVGGHVDHIIPKDAGGTDQETNLRAACPTCNLARGKGNAPYEPEPKVVTRW